MAVLLAAFGSVGCPSGPKDPLPPDEGTEIASAAPRALGALAGGTDAAPPVVLAPRPMAEDSEALPLPEPDDAGAAPPDAGFGADELPL